MVKGFQQITTLSAAAALTIPAGTRKALIQAEGQAVRWRSDGTDPTAAVGMRILTTADRPAEITLEMGLDAAKFIEETSGAKINVTYLG